MTDIKIFTVSDCGRCLAIKQRLDALGLPYTEINVSGNMPGLREMIRRSGSRQVPVTLVGEDVVIGPDLARLDAALNKRTAERMVVK